MKRHKMLVALLLILIIIFQNGVYAEDIVSNTLNDGKNIQDTKINNDYDLKRCIDEAVKNSLDIQLLEVQKEEKDIDYDKADFYRDKLSEGKDKIDEGEEALKQLKELYANLTSMGIPDNVPVPNIEVISGGKLPVGTTKADIKALIDDINNAIDKNYAKVADTLVNSQVKELLGVKASTEIDVVRYAMEIAKTQIGLLIQNSFYEAVKNEKIADIKKTTLTRLKEQERIASDAYNTGMKTKDDMLLSQIQESFAQIDLLNAQRLTNVSMYELKKNMNIDLTAEMNLKDDAKADIKNFNLDEGLKSGMLNRVEIKKANAEVLITKLNLEITKRYCPEYTFDYRTAALKVKNAEISLKKVKLGIEADIRKSYESLQKVQEMLKYTQGLNDKAVENVKIAKEKYQMGFDFPSANLKDLNLQEAAGTMIDVNAAEEKLSTVKEKLIELIYNYNQAKAKYMYDIGSSYWF